MKIEIWSDVMCPFCYIGKRNFEKALESYPNRDQVEVEWKSFQLNPAMKTEPGKTINQYLSEAKGWSMEQTQQANDHVTKMAAAVGLEYHMDKAVVANSFDAHRFIQFAKEKGKGNEAEEALFKAYFTDGKNTADHAVIVELGVSIGLDAAGLKDMLNSDNYGKAVQKDLAEAAQLGINSVPFFVINRQYAVAGAQPSELFINALDTSYKAFTVNREAEKSKQGSGLSCGPEGCD